MSVIDIRANSEKRLGLACDDGRDTDTVEGRRRSWTCKGSPAPGVVMLVGAIGVDIDRVERVLVSTTQLSRPLDAIAAQLLGFVATLPYDGADPSAARAWIEQNITASTATSRSQVPDSCSARSMRRPTLSRSARSVSLPEPSRLRL